MGAHGCRPAGRPLLSGGPGAERDDIAHTEAPSCRGGSRHTHRRSPSPRTERRRSDTPLSDCDSCTLMDTFIIGTGTDKEAALCP